MRIPVGPALAQQHGGGRLQALHGQQVGRVNRQPGGQRPTGHDELQMITVTALMKRTSEEVAR